MQKLVLISYIILYSCSVPKNADFYQKELKVFREKYIKGFIENTRSPLVAEDLAFLDFYTGDPSWNLTCKCVKVENAKPFEMPTYSGVTRTYILHSIATCTRNKVKFSLNLYKNIHQPINPIYKNNLFLPFKDYTNGEETYGGGRYINLLDTDIVGNKIIIDLNKSYNPWCTYSDGFNCPIPPRENHLELAVKAGEKSYKGAYKKTGV